MNENQYFTLTQLQNDVKSTLKERFNSAIYLKAEINQINNNRHCYMELIEKDALSDKIVAKMRAVIWSYNYNMLLPYFEEVTGRKIEAGMNVLLYGNIEFHSVYGLSFNVVDIDPNYTLGDIERQKQFTIKQLKKDGVWEMNKQNIFPVVPQRIAIISSETAAGYGDFTQHLINNHNSYSFDYKLFPAIMQGENAESSIISAFDEIFEQEENFDLVVLIRGGGSKSDLSCFDSYEIAVNIAQFPLPILTGIGHERDVSVCDMISFHSFKTPTAVASFLIDKVEIFDFSVNDLYEKIVLNTQNILQKEDNRLNNLAQKTTPILINRINTEKNNLKFLNNSINNLTIRFLNKEKYSIEKKIQSLKYFTKTILKTSKVSLEKNQTSLKNKVEKRILKETYRLDISEKSLDLLNPNHLLRKGYTISYQNGKIIKSVKDIDNNSILETHFEDGIVRSKVE